jgi:hypothetical protein
LLRLYGPPQAPPLDRRTVGDFLATRQTFLVAGHWTYSAADLLLNLLGLELEYVEGPTERRAGTFRGIAIPRPAFGRARADVAGFIRRHKRLPAVAWIGSETLSLADFTATLAGDDGSGAEVQVRKGNLEFEKYIATDPKSTFDWLIHPEGFRAPELLEMGRLQGWTLKPARLR